MDRPCAVAPIIDQLAAPPLVFDFTGLSPHAANTVSIRSLAETPVAPLPVRFAHELMNDPGWEKIGSARRGRKPVYVGGIAIAIKGMLLVIVATLGGLGWLGASELSFQQRVARLDADVAAFRRLRWERPLLRGEPVEGNAAEAFFNALGGLKRPSPALRQGLAEQLFYGQPLLPHQVAPLKQQSEILAELAASPQRTWSMTYLRPELGDAMPVPPYPKALDAALLLLARASTLEPDACLAASADVARIGQDLVPGAPLEASSVSMRIASLTAYAVRSCARRATARGLQRAERAFRELATHPPPVGHGLELADLVAGVEVRKASSLGRDADHIGILRTLQSRPERLKSWAYYDDPHRFRAWSPSAYPETLERWREEDTWRSQSGRPDVAAASAERIGWLQDDMRGQAILRALTVALSALAERERRGRMPPEPAALRLPSLVDPFSGRPLRQRFDPASLELTVWSVGEDLRDGNAEETWNERAPLDVIVRLRAPKHEQARRRAGRRGR
ncbi:MAG: hypothetical protein OXR73_16320 [Myxococcales bacterium]|nr:hypothetical protein [Myxococcales bacterium]